LVRVDEIDGTCFWMDQTEVTVEAYASWLKATPTVTWDHTYCQWKKQASDPISDPSLCSPALSAQDQDPFGNSKPIRCIDFCDAEAFCRSHGKNLCYDFQTIGTGGPRGYTREWRIACTNDLTTVYPWGDDPDERRCQTGQTQNGCSDNACGPTTVGQRSRCSDSSGVLDLIGNVAEWTYACTAFDPKHPSCLVRGGSYVDLQKGCDAERSISNDNRPPDVGFRCCEDLDATERAKLESGPTHTTSP
jgi:sulfatase modifying factor 1